MLLVPVSLNSSNIVFSEKLVMLAEVGAWTDGRVRLIFNLYGIESIIFIKVVSSVPLLASSTSSRRTSDWNKKKETLKAINFNREYKAKIGAENKKVRVERGRCQGDSNGPEAIEATVEIPDVCTLPVPS